MGWFEKSQRYEEKLAVAKLEEALLKTTYLGVPSNPVNTSESEEPVEEEWVWINGYKGTESDMKCRDYQFEMNGTYRIPDHEKVEMCGNGFHLCKELNDVFVHYSVGRGHRFFEVRAFVRKSDLDNYAESAGRKLVARTITFCRELEVDEIVRAYFDKYGRSYTEELRLDNWTEEQKRHAIAHNFNDAVDMVKMDHLASLGYSRPFSKLITNDGAYEIAKTVGIQEGLSMDMKALYIFTAIQNRIEDRRMRDYARPEYRPSYRYGGF